jgi:hypothetical protein
MISTEELKNLIEIEKRVRPGKDHDTHLRFDFYEPDEEIEKLCQEEFATNYASNFLLESYCWRTFEYVNDHLRNTCGIPTDEFVKEYQSVFNKLLDGIESYNDKVAWRWVNCFEGFEYLKSQVGRIFQIPEFKSTSVRQLQNRTYWHIKTHERSNGKMIFNHIDKGKGEVEKEILFKSNSAFVIESVEENCIFIREVKNEKINFILCENYWQK